MRRTRQRVEHKENLDRWLLTYAEFCIEGAKKRVSCGIKRRISRLANAKLSVKISEEIGHVLASWHLRWGN